MIISATLSKPTSLVQSYFDKDIIKIKLTAKASSNGYSYFAEEFTKTQVFHEHFTEQEMLEFLELHAGKTFKNCVKRTESQEITILANKKGKITTLTKNIKTNAESGKSFSTASESARENGISGGGIYFTNAENESASEKSFNGGAKIPSHLQKFSLQSSQNKKKKYIINEGDKVPFLILLGVMNDEGKVISSKYDKFRQINRYLEFIDDILPAVQSQIEAEGSHPVRIADFGCGKSYLTFAVHYFLTQVKKIPCQIEGLDLKKDVIEYCNQIAKKLDLQNLIFRVGNIADYSSSNSPDIVITLHACDTATDFALKYAVSHNAKAILSVPCCQHQINSQIRATGATGAMNSIAAQEINSTASQEIDSSSAAETISAAKSNSSAAENTFPPAAEFSVFEPLLKWGIIKEKFSSLVTDALRGEWLEQMGYKVQMLEFIDIEHTPKNILIRAVKKSQGQKKSAEAGKELPRIITSLNIRPEIFSE